MKIVLLIPRKAGWSREKFRTYYENNHVPLINSLFPHFSDYRRNYVTEDYSVPGEDYQFGGDENALPAPDYDVVTEISFDSREDYERTMAAMADPEISHRIAQDEEKFINRQNVKMYLVDEIQGGSNKP